MYKFLRTFVDCSLVPFTLYVCVCVVTYSITGKFGEH